MRDDGSATIRARHLYAVERLRERAYLVDFDENRICNIKLYAFLKKGCVGDEEVVADELHAASQFICQRLPSVPIIFGHPVFNRDYWILLGPAFPEGYHLVGRELSTIRLFEDVRAPIIKLARRRIER